MYVIKSGVIYSLKEGKETEFQSPFAEELFQQDSGSWESDAWKYKENEGDASQGMVSRQMLWGGKGQALRPMKCKARYVCAVRDRLYYVLEMRNSCGLFYYDTVRKEESRLFHKTEFQPRGLFVHDDYSILTTTASADGSASLVRFDKDGKREEPLTSGDCVDENPFWRDSKIYYQSSGIARNDRGIMLRLGPTSINALDLETGEVETVLASEKYDYLLPKVGGDGALYCIRVTHHTEPQYLLKDRLIDLILFPWRLGVAVFAFLNVFSLFFAKKPLTAAGGPESKMDMSQRILHNRVINLQETMRKEKKKVAVSRDWKLIRCKDGVTTEVASHVLWFDIDDDGTPVFTDGYAIYNASGANQHAFDELVSGLTVAVT